MAFTPTQLNLAIAAPAAAAEKNLALVGAGNLNTVVKATTPGVASNSITVALTGDSAPAAGVTISRVGKALTIHYESGVSTVAQVEAAITALTGADDIIGVKFAGTGATVLTAPGANFAATALAGGAAGRDITGFMLGDNRYMPVGTKGRYDWAKDDTNELITFTPKNMAAVSGLAADAPGQIFVAPYEDIKHVNYTIAP